MNLWENPPYYLTAYGLAVKHGYTGTEEQWLADLKGEKGDGLDILGTYDSLDDLKEAYPSGGAAVAGKYFRVGSETDYLLYYWDRQKADWYCIDIIGPKGEDGEDGKSAYEQATAGGYTGTEAEFNADLAGFKTQAANAAASATAASAAKTAAETAAGTATTQATNAQSAAEGAAASAQTAIQKADDAQASATLASQYAAQAEGAVGASSWITFEIEEDGEKQGWLYCIEAETYTGPDFSVNDDNGSYQGWLEVSYT